MNVCAICGDAPQFSISINGTPASDPCATFIFNTTCSWKYYEVYWNSLSNTSANICITNLNTYAGGNDFALDDIEFRSCTTGGPCVAFPLEAPVLEYVKSEQNQVQLGFWIDEYLLSNSQIAIERSNNSSIFEEIASVKERKAGMNTFIDKYPVFNQQMHYRIKSVDKDGQVQYSNIRTTIVKKQETHSVVIYPNPAQHTDAIMLKYNGNTEQILSITLTDMSGKVLYHQENTQIVFDNNHMRIPVQLSSGCYSISIRFLDRISTQKILVY